MVIPAGILQNYFFSPDGPNFVNYGALGMIVGHEITHGFDVNGRFHDEEGKVFIFCYGNNNMFCFFSDLYLG